MSQQAFFFDGTRCSGCKTCMFACKDAYDLDVGTAYRRVFEYTGGDTVRNGDGTFGSTCFSYNVSVACNHCDDPVCVRVCPTEAMHKDEQTGLVSVNDRHCIGCGYCHLSCPYSERSARRSRKGALGEVRRLYRTRGRGREAGVRRGLPGSRAGLRAGRRDEEARRARGHRAVAPARGDRAEPVRQAVRRCPSCGIEGRRRGEPVGSWISGNR